MDSLPILPTLAVGAASLLGWYTVSRWQQRKQYPPGPMPYPVIGNLNYLMDKKKPWITFTELQKTYGDIFTLFFANQPTVILGNLDLIREGFLTKQNDFAGRPSSYTFEQFSKGGKDITFGQFGPVWKRQRKIVHAAIKKFATGDCLANLIHESAQKAFAEMDKVADTGEKFNPRHSLNMIIFNIICSMAFGKTFEYNDPFLTDFTKTVDELNEVLGSGLLLADFWPIFQYVPTNGQRLLKKLMREMFGLIEGTYAEHEKNFDETNLKDFVDYMLQSHKEAEKQEGKEATEGLTRDNYVMNILDIFLAGTDTSRFTLIWAVLFLAAYPEVQKKLQKEVDSVVEREEPLRIEHRANLPYTEAFLHELWRIRPIAPLALPHVTTCDTTVGGYNIPKGTQVMPNIWAVHMDPNNWEDPEAFKPERFLTEDGKMGPRISSWLPFSTGRRVCVGEAVAKTELHLAIAALIQRYNFVAPTGVTMDTNAKCGGQVLTPNDYEIILTKRK